MALESVGTLVDVIGQGLGAVNLPPSSLASQTSDRLKTNVRIAVGLNGPTPGGGSLSGADGKVDVRFYNDNGEEVGSPQVDHYCNSPNTDCEITITMDEDHKGQKATYGLFTGNNDAICIAYTTVAMADQSNFGWSGDWASTDGCSMGQTWYYSNVQVQNGPTNTYTPNCIWLDANGDQPATAFQVHYPDFFDEGGSLYTTAKSSPSQLCNNPSFLVSKGKNPNGIQFFSPAENKRNSDGPTGNSRVKRDDRSTNAKRDKLFGAGNLNTTFAPLSNLTGTIANSNKYTSASKETRLVTSHHENHLASILCGHPYAVGPDLISIVENQYCDMHTKTIYPLCAGSSAGNGTAISYNSTIAGSSQVLNYRRDVGAIGKGCFDVQSHSIMSGLGRLARRQAKQYSEHMLWVPGQ